MGIPVASLRAKDPRVAGRAALAIALPAAAVLASLVVSLVTTTMDRWDEPRWTRFVLGLLGGLVVYAGFAPLVLGVAALACFGAAFSRGRHRTKRSGPLHRDIGIVVPDATAATTPKPMGCIRIATPSEPSRPLRI